MCKGLGGFWQGVFHTWDSLKTPHSWHLTGPRAKAESLGELKGKEFLGFITKGGTCNFKGFTRAGLARVSTAVESSELPEKQGS